MSKSQPLMFEHLEPLAGAIMAPRLMVPSLEAVEDTMEETLARAQHLAAMSGALAASIDDAGVRDVVRQLTLSRKDVWCIVDIVEPTGALRRLPIVHSDPAKATLIRELEGPWMADVGATPTAKDEKSADAPVSHARGSGAALTRAANGVDNLRVLE